MADKNIGSLPAATEIQDDTLLVGEQQGVAVYLTGAQFKAVAQTTAASTAQETFEKNYDRIVSSVLEQFPGVGAVTQNGSVLTIE